MNGRPRRNSRLQERDYDLLDHVMRYRLTTPQVLHQLFFSDCDRNAVTKVTSRLCQHSFLESHALYGSNTYFTMGRAAARLFGVPARRIGPLGAIALYREYGVFSFCCQLGKNRERLRVKDIQRQMPQILSSGIDGSHYYLDSDQGQVRLGYIWVEGSGSTEHIVSNVASRIIEPRRAIPALLDYIDKGRFLVAIVTLTSEKREQITLALRNLQTRVVFRVEVVPELSHLLPEIRHV